LLQRSTKHCAVIKFIHPNREQLKEIIDRHGDTELLNKNSVLLHKQTSTKIAALLADAEQNGLQPKQIRFDSVNLESLFISLTSHGKNDV
jgi:hypothetical protein